MRTTVEIKDSQRAQLLRMAAERRQKGFSTLVQEAIQHFLDEESGRHRRVVNARRVLGTLGDRAADAIEASVGRLRARWR